MELPYTVRQEEEDGWPVYVLEDRAARSQVWIAPGLGFNAYRFSLEPGEHGITVIDPPAILEDLRREPAGFGMPILFPFPGRIPHGRFSFRGRSYELRERPADGHAIHGLVLNRPWQVIASGPSEEGAVVVGRFESQLFPELADQYPSAFRLEVTCTLRAWTLTVLARAENVGPFPLPVGYGLHPYFHVPLDHGSSAGGYVIAVPVTRRWGLAGLTPTGRILPLEEDLAAGVSLEGRRFDDVYTGVLVSQGASRAVLSDTRSRLVVTVEADPQFREWVVYTPPRPAVCLEPWTCAPNAINLQERGIEAGLAVLEPREWKSWRVRLTVQQVA